MALNLILLGKRLTKNVYKSTLHKLFLDLDRASTDSLYDNIVQKISSAAEDSFPVKRYNMHAKPYCSAELKKPCHPKQRHARNLWISESRPRGRLSESCTYYKLLNRAFQKSSNQFYKTG